MQAVRDITNALVYQPGVDTSDPASLRAMDATMWKIARAVDDLFESLAAEAGITGHVAQDVGTFGLEADLSAAMRVAIDRAEEAERQSDAFDPREAWGTLNHGIQGIGR